MTHGPPPVILSTRPYRSGAEHLRDELARVDLLVRAQVVRWRMTLAETKPPEHWGMLHVTDAEIAAYLAAPIAPPDFVPERIREIVGLFWEAEAETGTRIRALLSRTRADVTLPVERLRARFALDDVESDVVLLCLLPAIDVRYRRIVGYLQDDASKQSASAELLTQMIRHKAGSVSAARALFEANRALRRHRLIAFDDDTGAGAVRAVRIDEGLASILLGSSATDPRLAGVMADESDAVAWDELFVDDALRSSLCDFAANVFHGPVIFHGPRGSGRDRAARAVASQRNTRLFHFDVGSALRSAEPWEQLVALVYRDAQLLDASVYVSGVDQLYDDEREPHRWRHLLDVAQAFRGITFLAATQTPESVRESALVRFDFPIPHYELRRAIWAHVLPASLRAPERDRLVDALATAFQITEGQIRDAVAAARATAQRRSFAAPAITRDDLFEACRKQAGHRLLGFARRIEPTRALTLDDVVLNDANKTQLRELMDRVRLRGRIRDEMGFDAKIALSSGLVALFAGPSGVGKTLSAELLANQQGVDLYKVDLSAVVSKYVGETEKNLKRIFDEAEDSDAMLFFDECESLFGQRGETSTEATGRWANLQVNYLLQRIEEYSGIVVLATNLRKNIDDAFLRRIQIILEFATPDAGMRLRIWKRTVPAGSTGISDAEFRAIADRFALTGGSMRNASVDAAFRALAAGRKTIGVRDLLDAVAREYQKLGKPITQGEFGPEFYGWALQDILDPQGPLIG
ncbi:MAG TPA: ATP-binding protein [Candidatus Elarobacter sp.]|jgi:AAA+ superfamily predicted ATPase